MGPGRGAGIYSSSGFPGQALYEAPLLLNLPHVRRDQSASFFVPSLALPRADAAWFQIIPGRLPGSLQTNVIRKKKLRKQSHLHSYPQKTPKKLEINSTKEIRDRYSENCKIPGKKLKMTQTRSCSTLTEWKNVVEGPHYPKQSTEPV